MSRQIKFRAYHNIKNMMFSVHSLHLENAIPVVSIWRKHESMPTNFDLKDIELMQFTGLHDKNSLKELYEGDIIDADGNLKGNIYESPQVYEEGIDCLIEGMGTEKWRSTESIAMGRGCKYSK